MMSFMDWTCLKCVKSKIYLMAKQLCQVRLVATYFLHVADCLTGQSFWILKNYYICKIRN